MDNNTIIQTDHLVKRFPIGGGHFTALEDIDLRIGKGEFTGLVGPSGSGKTTMLNIIGSLDDPSEGDAQVLGTSIKNIGARRASTLRKKHIGFIFQTYNLMPVYTVFENVEFPLLLLKMSDSERKKAVMDALEWVGLTSKVKSKPKQLSGGESQRVAIARAMVKKPELVLADEPTANLDAENSHNILRTMEKLNEELNTTFLFATHDDKVIRYLKRIIYLEDGKVVGDEQVKK
ncbi:MAG: ABC transporter ATP-binding protein [Bacteroidales bacterium]|nr:ABC transporter ATP-binding protein [Bacteroidales bacterium]MDT8430215.1 ABC transporter ATP-binding protein [Bacteroidales bacterium]